MDTYIFNKHFIYIPICSQRDNDTLDTNPKDHTKHGKQYVHSVKVQNQHANLGVLLCCPDFSHILVQTELQAIKIPIHLKFQKRYLTQLENNIYCYPPFPNIYFVDYLYIRNITIILDFQKSPQLKVCLNSQKRL